MTRATPEGNAKRAMFKAARDAGINRIEELLTQGPLSASDLTRITKISNGTLNGYLRYMHETRRSVRPTDEKLGKSTVWELGEDPTLPANSQSQLLKRDYLVAALFGPAHPNT